MVATKTLEVPFDTGLSQKVDALWLEPGSASQITNLVKQKQGSMAKRLGLSKILATGVIPASGTNIPVSFSLNSGKRLYTHDGCIGIIGTDALGDAAIAYDDQAARMVMLDRAPETYIAPADVVAGGVPNIGSAVPSGRVYQLDTLASSGYELHVWTVGDINGGSGVDIYYMVRNAATAATVIAAQVIESIAAHSGVDVPKLTLCGTNAVLSYSTGDHNIYARVMDMTSPGAWSAESQINVTANDTANAGLGSDGAAYDVSPSANESGFMALVYERTAPSHDLIVVRLAVTSSTVTISSSSVVPTTTWAADAKPIITGFAIRADRTAGECAISYSWTTVTPATRVAFQVATWPALGVAQTAVDLLGTPGPISTAAISGAYVIALESLGTVGGNASCYKIMWSPGGTTWRNGDAATSWPFIASYIAGNNGAGAAVVLTNQPRVTWNVTLVSRICVQNGRGYVVGYVPSDTQGSFFLFSDDAWTDTGTANSSSGPTASYFPLRLVGNLGPRQASSQTFTSNTMGVGSPQFTRVQGHFASNPYAQGGTVVQVLLPIDTSPITAAPALYRIDFASTRGYASAQLGGNTLFAGGCPSCFDGAQVFELGFPIYPIVKLADGGIGGSEAGTYLYIAVFRWNDAEGQVHTSARSVPASITIAGSKSVAVTVGICGFSARMKASNGTVLGPQASFPVRRYIQVLLYRTVNGGTVYYQVAQPKVVSMASPSVTFSDNWTANTTLQSQPLLYGDGSDGTQPGNLLDDECPPALQHLIVHKNRIYGIDGPRVWISKEYTTRVGSGVNEATAFSVDDGPGPLTALASLDAYLILFKSDRIFYMQGEGPEDNGAGNDLTPPQRIASDVGCLDWRSVVVTAKGIYFQSAAGRRLITRDLQVQPLPVVEDADASLSVTTSAVVHPTSGRTLWTQNTDDTSAPRNGQIVVNDYVLESWSLANLGVGLVSGAVATATNYATSPPTSGPNYYALDAAGNLYRENSIVPTNHPYYDQGTAFASFTWVSPWLKSDGLNGWSQWAKIRLLLRMVDPADLIVAVYYDYSGLAAQTHTFTAAQLAASITPLINLAILPVNQRAASMQISISDNAAASTATGAGFVLEDLRVDYNVEPGGYRTPTSQQK